MKLSLSMWSVHQTVRQQGWTVLDFLAFCKSEGIEQVELLNFFWKNQEQELEDAISYARDNGIRVSSYAVGNNFVQLNAEAREAALKEITDAIPVARRLGTDIIRVFSGDLIDHVTYETAIQWIVDGLAAAAKEAEASGVTLCLENHGKLAGSGAQVKEIIERVGSEALRSTFDTGNFLLVDEHPTDAAKTLLPYIAHVHVKDFIETGDGRYHSLGGKRFEGVSVGEGDVELDVILNMLNDNGYQGACVLEYEGLGSEAEGIRRSYENFKRYQ
jgi:sugar phosphate isomerase/epimerase